MNTRATRHLTRVCLAAAAFGTLLVTGVSAGSAEPGERLLATGSAIATIDEHGIRRTFAFTAVQRGDGTIDGIAQVVRHDNGHVSTMRIDCLRVDDSFQGLPTATVSGVNIRSSDPAFEGKPMWFKAVDGGVDSKMDATTLVVTFIGATPPVTCYEEWPLEVHPVTNGNVTIHGTPTP